MADIVLLFILKGRDCMSKVLIEVLVIILIAGSYLILYSAVRVSAMMQMIPENAEQKKNSDKPEEEAEPTDAALEEMSVLFAQGNFGEE